MKQLKQVKLIECCHDVMWQRIVSLDLNQVFSASDMSINLEITIMDYLLSHNRHVRRITRILNDLLKDGEDVFECAQDKTEIAEKLKRVEDCIKKHKSKYKETENEQI